MRKLIATPMIAGLVGLAALTAPLAAHASTSDTPVTFTVGGGGLSITEPGSASLAATVGDATATGTLGNVSVTDDRGTPGAGWTASAISTAFTGTDHAMVIPATSVSYSAGTISGNTAVGTFTSAGTVTNLTGVKAVVTASGETGNATVGWDPTLTIALPSSGLVADTYDATITESVA
jgi:hypothetical protein